MELKKRLKKRLVLFTVFMFGVMIPFIPSLTVIEMFFLVGPCAIIFFATSIYLIISLFNTEFSRQKALFLFSILPVFILTQVASVYIVDKIQRIRSENIIMEVQKIKNVTGEVPEQYDASMGIDYQRLRDRNNFIVSYSRGFMVKEKFNSEFNKWKSYGWND